VDAQDGTIAADEELADQLRLADKPVILAVNKVDSLKQESQVADFHRLSIGTPMAISAYHNRGIDSLMGAVLDSLPPSSADLAQVAGIKLAIVGRPNVGKSTLLNVLLGDERAIVDDIPGTTRDALDALLHWNNHEILLIDTAGIKRRGSVGAGIEYYSLLRALRAINRCDVALLLIDAAEFVAAQDMHIAGYILEAGKGMVLAVNKWDLVPQGQRREYRQQLEQRLKFMSYVPILYISAKLGQGIDKILPQAWQVWQEREKRLPQPVVDMVVKEAINRYPPPRRGLRQLRIIQAYQHESKPATFILRVNDPKLVHFSYQRYLENRLRCSLGFCGTPLQLIFTKAVAKAVKAAR
jgi:GTP-binding protein